MLHGFAWNHAAKLTEYVLVYLFSVLVARGLGPDANGMFASLLSVSYLLIAFSSAGIEAALTRFIPNLIQNQSNGQLRYIVRRLLAVKILLLAIACTVVAIFWNPLAHRFALEGSPTEFVVFISVFVVVRGLGSLFGTLLLARFRTKELFFCTTVPLLLQIGAVLLLGPDILRLEDVIIVVLGGQTVTAISLFLLSRDDAGSPEEEISLRPVLTFSGLLWANVFVDYFLGKQGDVVFLAFFAIPKNQIGWYDISFTLSQIPSFGMAAGFMGVSLATFASSAGGKRMEFVETWTKLNRLITRMTLPLYCFGIMYAREIIHVCFSDAYLGAVPLMQVLFGARILTRFFGGGENTDALLALSKERLAVSIALAAGVVNVAGNCLLIPPLGAMGAAVSTGCVTIAVNAATAVALRQSVGAEIQGPNWIAMLIIGVVPPAVTSLLIPSHTFGSLLGTAFVCLVLWSVGVVALYRRELKHTGIDMLPPAEERV